MRHHIVARSRKQVINVGVLWNTGSIDDVQNDHDDDDDDDDNIIV